MRHHIFAALAAATFVFGSWTGSAWALSIGQTFHFTDNRGPNTLGFTPDYRQNIQANITDITFPLGFVSASQNGVVQNLTALNLTLFPDRYAARRLVDGSLLDSWFITGSDRSGTTSVPALTRAIPEPQQVPLVNNLQIMGTGLTPTLTWELPDLTGFDIDRIRVRAIDAATRDQFIQSGALLADSESFIVPNGWLSVGGCYAFRVLLEDLEDGVDGSPQFLENRSSTYSEVFTPVPERTYSANFTGLGDLTGLCFSSSASGVSADGSVVVGSSFTPSGREAFRWTSGSGMVGLGDLPGGMFNSHATDVSADGSVVVGSSITPSGVEAFRWTSGSGMVGLGELSGGGFFSSARGVSADGSVVVGQGRSPLGREAFRWTTGSGMVGLGDLPGGNFDSIALGVSADGSVVVGQGRSPLGREAFRWTTGSGMVGLGDLPGGNFDSIALGVSADGSVVVGSSFTPSGVEAFRWTSGSGMVGLGDLPGGIFESSAFEVSADGSVVVGQGRSPLGREAFIWDSTNGMRSLANVLMHDYGVELAGWTLERALAISGDGQTIVGYGTNPSGNTEAWVANISTVPEPATIAIDIKPDSDPNSINPKSEGVTAVAILTTGDFDATTVDVNFVRFGPDGAPETHGKGHMEDLNFDGYPDLVLHFKTQETGIQCGDTSASLTGETFDGEQIEGSDSVRTVGCE